jgi:adenylate cyclase
MGKLARALGSRPAMAVASSALLFVAIAALRLAGALEPLELAARDLGLRAGIGAHEIDARVIIVEQTERDLEEQGRLPLDDGALAGLLVRVRAGEPRAIGVDFYRDMAVPPGSDRLERLLRADPRIVLIHRYGDDALLPVPPPPLLAGSDRVGFADLALDADGTVRRAFLFRDDETYGAGLSLALRVASLWLAPEGLELSLDPDRDELVRVGAAALPRLGPYDGGYARAEVAGYQFLLDFRGAPEPFRSVSVGEVLRGEVDPERFRDAIVLVGGTTEAHGSFVRTPFGRWPGLFVHAHAASQLVRLARDESRPVRTLPEPAELAWTFAWTLLGAFLALARRSLWTLTAGVAAGGIALAAAEWIAAGQGAWLPSVPAGLGWLGAAAVVGGWVSLLESRQRAVLARLFWRHVSPAVARALWEQRERFMDGARLRPQRLEATVLFVDVKDVSALGEKLEPRACFDWMNELIEAVAAEVHAHGGFVDDYFGDGLKADFGVPIPRRTAEQVAADARAAVRCAVRFDPLLRELSAGWRARGLPPGALRVGVCTGAVLAGSVGSREHLQSYTVLGDAVATAAGLEKLEETDHDFERVPCRILVSASTERRLGPSFATRDLGTLALRGTPEPVRVFEVLGERLVAAKDAAR